MLVAYHVLRYHQGPVDPVGQRQAMIENLFYNPDKHNWLLTIETKIELLSEVSSQIKSLSEEEADYLLVSWIEQGRCSIVDYEFLPPRTVALLIAKELVP